MAAGAASSRGRGNAGATALSGSGGAGVGGAGVVGRAGAGAPAVWVRSSDPNVQCGVHERRAPTEPAAARGQPLAGR